MLKKYYNYFCKIEEVLIGIGFMTIVLLSFMNAVLRKFNVPIVTADDICLLLFSWTAFLGADVALRYSRLVGMDILVSKLRPKNQKILQITVYVIMIGALITFAIKGYELALFNWKRTYNALPFSYGWATLSLPVGCVLMAINSSIKIGKIAINFNDDEYNVRKDNPGLVGEENAGIEEEEERKLIEENM